LNLSGLSGAHSREHGPKSRAFEPNAGQRIVCTEGRKTFGSGAADASIIEDRIQKARDFSPLLEDNLGAARRQSDERKRI
jgi:hypothetical protein